MDSGTFKLVAILILAVGFTVGAGFGVFNFDFGSLSDNSAVAIVTDTAFPDVEDIQVNDTVSNDTYDYTEDYVDTVEDYDSGWSDPGTDYSDSGVEDPGTGGDVEPASG